MTELIAMYGIGNLIMIGLISTLMLIAMVQPIIYEYQIKKEHKEES